MMRVLITGASGMLAQAVQAEFSRADYDLSYADLHADAAQPDWYTLDITDATAVQQLVAQLHPDVIINCAAYTAVDNAELQEDLAYRVNAVGPGNLAQAAQQAGATLVHISTDYVFGGDKPLPGEYSEDDPKSPNTAYGRTKLAGEEAVTAAADQYYIFRTAWLYGQGNNFVRTMLNLAQTHSEVTVVDDQWGSPTYAVDLARIIRQAVEQLLPYGVYHATNLGYTNWCDFAAEIFAQAGVECVARGVSSAEYAAAAEARAKAAGQQYHVAPRPANSQLSKAKLQAAGVTIPTWQDALKRYLKEELHD